MRLNEEQYSYFKDLQDNWPYTRFAEQIDGFSFLVTQEDVFFFNEDDSVVIAKLSELSPTITFWQKIKNWWRER